MIWGIWLVWGRGAIMSVIGLSHKKHNAAAWLESLGASNGFYKSERHIAHALQKSEIVTADYINQHKTHFRYKFSQTVCFLMLYALASALLLGLGGWLVIQGQLSLGQLIAAELILSAAFLGVSQLGTYLNYFYDLCAAIEELSLFLDVKQEEPSGKSRLPLHDASLVFSQVRGETRVGEGFFDFTIPSGACFLAVSKDHGLQRLTTALLKRHVQPKGGYITLGGCDIQELDVLALRQEIVLLDRPTLVETTIRDYLKLSCHHIQPDTLWHALRVTGLEPIIARLPQGLDTTLTATGWPLSITETMMLKLASAIVANPRVLILNQLFDLIPASLIFQTLNTLSKTTPMTVIYFSNRQQDIGFDHFLLLKETKQSVFSTYTDMENAISETGDIVFISENMIRGDLKKLTTGEQNNAIS